MFSPVEVKFVPIDRLEKKLSDILLNSIKMPTSFGLNWIKWISNHTLI